MKHEQQCAVKDVISDLEDAVNWLMAFQECRFGGTINYERLEIDIERMKETIVNAKGTK